jgi:hypothetical protein
VRYGIGFDLSLGWACHGLVAVVGCHLSQSQQHPMARGIPVTNNWTITRAPMDSDQLYSQLATIGERIETAGEQIVTEEATKTSLVLPFFTALGYDVFNPGEVVPEFDAGLGEMKDKKADYALQINGKPVIIVECKALSVKLSNRHINQLFDYFIRTEVKFALLTNGDDHWFYSETNKPNVMDEEPFLKLTLSGLSGKAVEELLPLCKPTYDLKTALPRAVELRNLSYIRKAIKTELASPSDDFVRLIANEVPGKFTAAKIESLRSQVKSALEEHLRSEGKKAVSQILDTQAPALAETIAVESPDGATDSDDDGEGIETTPEEFEGFYIVKAICAEVVSPSRIHLKDRKRYCKVLLDDRVQKPICVFKFGSRRMTVDFYDQGAENQAVEISSTADLYSHRERILASLRRLL